MKHYDFVLNVLREEQQGAASNVTLYRDIINDIKNDRVHNVSMRSAKQSLKESEQMLSKLTDAITELQEMFDTVGRV